MYLKHCPIEQFGVVSSILGQPHTFKKIDQRDILYGHSPTSADSIKAVVNYK